jgi:putative oxidoreductase
VRSGWDDLALLLLRVGFGLGMALAHGLPKVLALVAGDPSFPQGVARLGFPYPLAFAWISALTELVGGVCIALGLLTRVFAGLNAFNMVVAAFVRHHAHHQFLGVIGLRAFPEEVWKAWGKPESALLYLAGFTALLLMGAGAFSLDGAVVGGKKKPRRNYD